MKYYIIYKVCFNKKNLSSECYSTCDIAFCVKNNPTICISVVLNVNYGNNKITIGYFLMAAYLYSLSLDNKLYFN